MASHSPEKRPLLPCCTGTVHYSQDGTARPVTCIAGQQRNLVAGLAPEAQHTRVYVTDDSCAMTSALRTKTRSSSGFRHWLL